MKNISKKSIAVILAMLLAVPGDFILSEKQTVKDLKVYASTEADQVSIYEEQNTVHEKFYPYIHFATGAGVVVTDTGEQAGSVAESENLSRNNYSTWSSTVNSHLQPLEYGRVQRVEFIKDQVIVEEYSSEYKLLKQRKIQMELPIYGGYFCGNEYQFLVFGQTNMEESEEQEIMRVVKYDKDWKRLGAVSVKGANTTTPFDAGSLRMVEENGRLFIHTCHEMYRSGDGRIHQANMSYVVKEETMELQQGWNEVMNISYGYVSHSFNQYLVVEDGKLYRVDHGDAYPRSVVLTKCEQAAITNCGYENVWDIQGAIGNNKTGVSVGGFEKAGDYLVVVGNSTTQETEEQWQMAKNRNVFLTSTNANAISTSDRNWWLDTEESDIDTEKTKQVWLTNYTENDGIAVYTPQLVKASDQLLYVMWEERNAKTGVITVKLVGVDPQGNRVTETASIYGRLSDCKPFYNSDGTIQWYTSKKEKQAQVDIYKLDTRKLKEYSYTEPIDLSQVQLSINETRFIYQNGEPCEPKVFASYQGARLELGRDFTVSYSNNVRPGTGTVYVQGMGYFSGAKSLEFKIDPIDISDYRYVVTPASIVYDGQYHMPETSIYRGEQKLTIVGDEKNTYACEVGVYSITFSAKEEYGYTGMLTTSFEILPKEIDDFCVELPQTEYFYTGSEITPYVSVRDGNNSIYRDTDYIVEYENNINAGEAWVIITGKGNYKGVKKVPYKIMPVDLAERADYVTLENSIYIADGTAKAPRVTIYDIGKELKEGMDYTVAYTNNIEPGTAMVTITGMGNYAGEVVKTFVIKNSKETPSPAATKKPNGTSSPQTAKPGETGTPTTAKPTTRPGETSTPATKKPTTKPEETDTTATAKPTSEEPVKGNTYTVNGYKYRVLSTTKVSVVGATSKKKPSITINAQVMIGKKRFKITEIGKNAFKDYKKLTRVKIGKNVTKLGAASFSGDKKLKQVEIESVSVKSVGKDTFKNIHTKATIKIKAKGYKKIKKLLTKKVGVKKTMKIMKY